MSDCSTLFYSPSTENETLFTRISLTTQQDTLQRDKWKRVYDFLETKLRDIYPDQKNWRSRLQGSVQYATQIRPMDYKEEYDIDLGVYVNSQTDADYFDDPSNYKSNIQELLHSYAFLDSDVTKVMSPDKNFCCRVHFKNSFHIDVVAYHHNFEDGLRLAATKTKGWSYSDPKKLYDWFKGETSEELDRARLRRLIKYFKAWAGLSFEESSELRPSSIYLTVLCTRMYKKLDHISIGVQGSGDDIYFHEMLKKIRDHVSALQAPYEKNPVEDENICRLSQDGLESFKSILNQSINLSSKAIYSSNLFESALLWGEIFKHFMPLPQINEESKCLPSVWTLPEVQVIATNKNDARKIGNNQIGPIGKEYKLEFRIINQSSFPSDAKVSWTVRNFGDESGNINDLGHRSFSEIYECSEENTAYVGTHYMDCLVYSPQSGSLYGIRSVPVNVNHAGFSAPSRNPARLRYGPRR